MEDKTIYYTQKLKQAGCNQDMINEFCKYLSGGNLRGQQRLVADYRQLQYELMLEKRWQLSCIDYLIVKWEQALKSD